ncbi:MAG: GH25 family lysozyme, partial [Nocardioidaceae bacterium]
MLNATPAVPRRSLRRTIRVGTAGVVALLTLTTTTAFAMQRGVDTSHYQHKPSLNWTAVAKSGVKFAFLKATESTTFRDPYFAADWAATAKAGIYRGAYHFARPRVGTAVAQARYFASVIGPQTGRGTLPPVLDLEVTGGLSPKQLITWTRNWLVEVQRLTRRDPMIYVSPAFWEERLNNSTAFHHYPLWIANYGVKSPRVPGGWPTFSFWQSTSTGRIPGISGNVDKDSFNGNLIQLQKFALAFKKSATALTLAADNPAPQSGQAVTFTGTLRDPAGKAVAGRKVTLSTSAPGANTWSPLGTAATTKAGAFTFSQVVSAAGDYRVGFAGDADYKPSSSPVEAITLTPIPTTLSLASTAASTLAGTTLALSGDLATSAKQPLATRRVTISRLPAGSSRWQRIATVTTDATGAFTTKTKMMTTARYRATFAGEPAYARVNSTAQAITVKLNPVALTMKANRHAPRAGQVVTFAGTLDNGAVGVAGRHVVLQRQAAGTTTWGTVTSPATDSKGHWSARVRVSRAASYRAAFTGDSLYAAAATAGTPLTITPPTKSRLTIADSLGRSGILRTGRSTTLSGTLTTVAGKPVSHRWVRL